MLKPARAALALPAALPAIALLALSACGSSAKNEQAEAAATIAADSNATMAEANRDVQAASDAAIGGDQPGNADAMIDDGSNVIEE